MSETPETPVTATLPSFVAEIDRLSDELELFGFPRMLSPEFMPANSDAKNMEMDSVKVLDLLNTLMDSLWTVIQAKHRDRELQSEQGDGTVRLKCELKKAEIDFQHLQIKIKKKNHELVILSKEAVALKSCQKQMTSNSASQEETIRRLRSQLKHLHESTICRLEARDNEIARLKEKLKQSLGEGISHGSRRPTESQAVMAAREETGLLKDVILNYQKTTEVLVKENLALKLEKDADEEMNID